MAKLRGTGIAAVNYPTGMNLGGDPSQALIHATTSGSFVVTLSATDLGQGLRTVIGQIAAETLGVAVRGGRRRHRRHRHRARTTWGRSPAGRPIGSATPSSPRRSRPARRCSRSPPRSSRQRVDEIEFDGHGNLMVTGVPARSVKVADDRVAGPVQVRPDDRRARQLA